MTLYASKPRGRRWMWGIGAGRALPAVGDTDLFRENRRAESAAREGQRNPAHPSCRRPPQRRRPRGSRGPAVARPLQRSIGRTAYGCQGARECIVTSVGQIPRPVHVWCLPPSPTGASPSPVWKASNPPPSAATKTGDSFPEVVYVVGAAFRVVPKTTASPGATD
jgi:hypothetical protein